jgi:hypothetical protein
MESAARSKRVYRWTRDLHLYAGLFSSPFVLLYALSVIFLVHSWLPWGGAEGAAVAKRTIPVAVRNDSNSLMMAKQVRDQIGIAGEIGYVNRNEAGGRLSFPLESAGRRAMVEVDLHTGQAEVEQRETGAWDGLIYLHKMPGPHNAAIRGNWLPTRLWGWLADATVYLLLFLSASGVYLWTVLRAERKAGLIFLGSGVLSFVLLISAIVG